MKTSRRVFVIFVVCALLLSLSAFAFAANGKEDLPVVLDLNECITIPVYYNGIKVGDGVYYNENTYVSLRSFFSDVLSDSEITWDAQLNIACVTAEDFELTAALGDRYITANGRCFFVPDGVVLAGGFCSVPVRVLTKMFNLEVGWDEATASVSIKSTEESGVPAAAEDFYNEEDLYWLAQVINAESGNQSLDGKIGVGNVVINRVADKSCPDTIHDVIFDDRFGEQFSVVSAGTIYDKPNEESVVAAKLCLEGYNTVENAIYFVNPKIGSTRWFREQRTFVISIDEHDFYA